MSDDYHVLVGHLGKDAEMRYLDNGDPVVNFSIAVNGYERGEKTVNWYSISWFGKTAEKTAQYLVKGKQVQVLGSGLTVRLWEKDGASISQLQLKAMAVTLLGGGEKAAEVPF